jgi:hypothetical protein
MKHLVVLGMFLLSTALTGPVQAQSTVKTNLIDHSNDTLIDEATAKAVLTENIPAKVWKIHSPRNYTFVSQVEGGLNAAKTCVVTARVMVLPLTAAMKAPMFRPLPKLTATAYDAAANSSTDQCKALAKDKLKEATLAVVSSIVKS